MIEVMGGTFSRKDLPDGRPGREVTGCNLPLAARQRKGPNEPELVLELFV
jgi:hypothetical protein